MRTARLLDLLVLRLDLVVALRELLRLLFELLVGLLQFALLRGAASVAKLAATGSAATSVRIIASIEFNTMPIDAVSCSRNEICRFGENCRGDANSMTALIWPSNSTGSTNRLFGGCLVAD